MKMLIAAAAILALAGCGTQTVTKTVTGTSSANAAGGTASAPRVDEYTNATSSPTQFNHCFSDVFVNSQTTSCPFARRVFDSYGSLYESTGTLPSRISAFSPVTHKTYVLSCARDAGTITCTDATGSFVQFSKNAFGAPPAVPSTTPTPSPTTTASIETPGSSSHDTDGQFCSAHSCIENFDNGNGTIVQCVDGEWSHSGGLSGACSDHGGES